LLGFLQLGGVQFHQNQNPFDQHADSKNCFQLHLIISLVDLDQIRLEQNKGDNQYRDMGVARKHVCDD
jgi:hypothetical protein